MALSRVAFPCELILDIIDECADDEETLRAFALTCRDLLSHSRKHLFRDIRVDSKKQHLALSEFLYDHPALVHSVSYRCFWHQSDSEHEPVSLTEVVPFQAPDPSQFCNLRKWTLIARSACSIDIHPEALPVFKTYPCLEELELVCCRFRSRVQFFQFVTAFLRLRALHLDNIAFQSEAGRGEDPGEQPLRLSTLKVSYDRGDSGDTIDVVKQVLHLSRSSLLHLDLGVFGSARQSLYIQQIPTLTRLCSLGVIWSEPADVGIGVYTDAVRAVSSSTFERVSITLSRSLDDFYTLRKVFSRAGVAEKCREFDEAVNALCGGRVTLVFTTHEIKTNRRELVRAMLGDAFPALHSRDRLRVEFARNTLPGHDRAGRSLAVSPNGRLLASSAIDESIILWDVSGRDLRVLRDWEAPRDTPLAFSPDSTRLAAAVPTNHTQHAFDPISIYALSVWDSQGEKIATLQDHKHAIVTVYWSPDGSLLVSGSRDKTMILWDARTFQLLRRVVTGASSVHCSPLFSPDGRWLATGDDVGQCTVWEAGPSKYRRHATFSLGALKPISTSLLLAIDYASEHLAAAAAFADSEHIDIHVFSIVGNGTLTIPTAHRSRLSEVVFSPDGKAILSASWDSIKVWNSLTGDLLLSLEGHRSMFNAACFSPDGMYIASASSDKTVRLWRASDGSCVANFGEHTDQVNHVVFSPDGETLFSAAVDGTVCMRRLRDIIPGYAI